VVVQTLWHVLAFRKALLGTRSGDELVIALQQIFAELSATEAAVDEGAAVSADAISPEALRRALSATDSGGGGGRFKLRDMADAAEAFEALLERLAGSVTAARLKPSSDSWGCATRLSGVQSPDRGSLPCMPGLLSSPLTTEPRCAQVAAASRVFEITLVDRASIRREG
jgi:hypothetical protein